ncbi:RNA polymerase II elongation factor ELL-like [Paralichthys olivaceus]|uniref:RNA polymerase II elongation factor ELL-like n=1 Tax=Paralichthys olivaceus TaxID=8255 RepID=UPI00097CEE3A|nr:PREDICTED: RNA polymerase II elongation factor ELL-like isoform X2 [Paralichthys olivaceus]
MSLLSENQSYGLSSGELSRGGNVSVFHVKLTDSAARAIDFFQTGKGWSSHPTICFNGNQGRISIPCSENRDDVRIFTFGVTNVARDNPNGSFDCVQQLSTGAAKELSCLGVIQKKMTVNATDDSYDKARQSMAQAEEETRSRGTIVIKHGGRYQGKKVTVRAPAPALASLTKPRPSSQSFLSNIKRGGGGVSKLKKGACVSNRRSMGDVQERPLRERLTHLLALRPYKRPELILRLQKDGFSAEDKDMLDSVVMEVGQLNSRDNTFVLRDSLYKDLQKDWPGYTPGDQQLLKRILVRRLFQPQQNLLTAPEAQVSPLRDTPNSSPAHRPKPSLPEEYTDPLVSKKPRISHLSSKTPADKSRLRPSGQVSHRDCADARAGDGKNNSLDPRKLFDSLSVVCQREDEVAKRLEPSPCAQQDPGDLPPPDSDRPPSPLIVPDLSRRTTKRKKSKHKHRDKTSRTGPEEKEKWRGAKERRKDQSSDDTSKVLLDCSEPSEILFDSTELQVDNDSADYLSMYTVICNHDQRQSYKEDFNKEYYEYRDLHARIDGVTRQFMELDTQRKQLHQESHKYKTVHDQILQEYRKIKKSNPNYNKDKLRCEYLHNKLAHIKKLISQYDKQQLSVDHSCPK